MLNKKYNSNLVFAFLSLAVIGFSIIFFLTLRLVNITNDNFKLISKLNSNSENIIYLDEVLTMSARMNAFTGDSSWEKRYRENVLNLDKSIEFIKENSPQSFSGQGIENTNKANDILISLEEESFKLVKKQDVTAAKALLFSTKYLDQKEIYSKGITDFKTNVEDHVKQLKARTYKSQLVLMFLLVVVFLISILVGIYMYRRVKKLDNALKSKEKIIEDRTNQLALMGEISQGLIHDLMNPITILDLSLRNLSKEFSDKKDVSRAVDSTNYMKSIIKNIKSLSTNESQMRKSKNKLIDIVKESITFSKKRLDFNGVKNVEICFDENIDILIRPSQLSQIIINLLINASDAIKDLEEKWIKIDSFQRNGIRYIKVIDSGPGLPSDISNFIFDPSFTTKERGEGTGLGLSLSKKLIESMNGELIYDQFAKQTTFIISFPEIELIDSELKEA